MKTFYLAGLVVLCLGCQSQSQLVKTELKDNWQFRKAGDAKWMPATVPGTVHTDLLANKVIEDPFYRTNERDQQWIDKEDWEYETTFTVDAATLKKKNIELDFKGLDTYADIYLNDSLLTKTDNMFRRWNVNCKPYLKKGNNTLRILFHSPIKIGLQKLAEFGYALPAANDQSENGGLGDKKVSPFTRKAGYHYGWDWGPRFVTSGIWRPVYLVAWNQAKINAVQYSLLNLTKEKAAYTANFEVLSDYSGEAELAVTSETDHAIASSEKVELKPGVNNFSVNFTISEPKLWYTNGLGDPFLYNITCDLNINGKTIDSKSGNLGVRTVKIIQKPDSLGKSFYVELNGQPVFMKGANYIPNDIFLPRVTHEEYDKVVKSAADANMNMLRVWGGGVYEDDYFYDLCDKYGILVWQDFMFACSMYPGDSAFLNNVKAEAIDNVKRMRNHPCIALWCGNNEIDIAWSYGEKGGWGWKEKYTPEQQRDLWHAYDTIFQKILPAVISIYDAGRFYWPSSPLADWNSRSSFAKNSGDIHYWDVWWGQVPFSEYKTHIGRFMSEYGFQSFPELKTIKAFALPQDFDIFSEVMKAHQRSSIGNGTIKNYMQRDFRVPSDFEDFLYVGQILQAEGIKVAMEAHRRSMPYCMGSLFWQLNDCWPVASWSSTDYYRRWKALQYYAERSFKPVIVSVDMHDGKLDIYGVSDRQAPAGVTLGLRVMDYSGNIISKDSLQVNLPANASHLIISKQISSLTGSKDAGTVFLNLQLKENGKILSSDNVYFKPFKDITFPEAKVDYSVEQVPEGYKLVLSCPVLAKSVYLSTSTTDGFFSDNYFDLLPGEKREILFTTNVQAVDLKKELQIKTLNNL